VNAQELASQAWRLSNLYWIVDEHGKAVPFRPNPVQVDFLSNLWHLNVILKSRQHGFTTLIDIYLLDCAVFNRDMTCGIIAHGLREAQSIFDRKVKFPYDRLPDGIKATVAPVRDSRMELALSNGSSVIVGTSMRSGTVQRLHVSEFGKISRRSPDKANEIVTGAFQAVHPGEQIFVESTADGRGGQFYSMVQTAKKLTGRPLSPLDFRLHFYAWHHDQRNRIAPEWVTIDDELAEYFAELEAGHGIKLDDQQKAWYAKKRESLVDLIYAEHPSTPDEAFKAAAEGAILGKQLAMLYERKQIGHFPHIPGIPVNTFWDIGRSDFTSIWFHQRVGSEHRFIGYYENRLMQTAHYATELQRRQAKHDYLYGRHYLPHDATIQTIVSMSNTDGRTFQQQLEKAGVKPTEIVRRIPDIHLGIDLLRQHLPRATFDQAGCSTGLDRLENYSYEFDERLEVFKPHPRHDDSTHAADAIRQWAQAGVDAFTAAAPTKSKRSFRTA